MGKLFPDLRFLTAKLGPTAKGIGGNPALASICQPCSVRVLVAVTTHICCSRFFPQQLDGCRGRAWIWRMPYVVVKRHREVAGSPGTLQLPLFRQETAAVRGGKPVAENRAAHPLRLQGDRRCDRRTRLPVAAAGWPENDKF